jgi:hypothetical protein
MLSVRTHIHLLKTLHNNTDKAWATATNITPSENKTVVSPALTLTHRPSMDNTPPSCLSIPHNLRNTAVVWRGRVALIHGGKEHLTPTADKPRRSGRNALR